MKPTNKLRWVERIEHRPIGDAQSSGCTSFKGLTIGQAHKAKILQQWWEHKSIMDMKDGVWGEWRDVPVEVEE